MGAYVEFSDQQSNQNAELAATLTAPELPNLFSLLDHVHAAAAAMGDAWNHARFEAERGRIERRRAGNCRAARSTVTIRSKAVVLDINGYPKSQLAVRDGRVTLPTDAIYVVLNP
ncbi:MAG: hypothetical protein ABI619_10190 [Betaproteobacteria bacterium]